MSVALKKPNTAPKEENKPIIPVGTLLAKVLDSEGAHTSFGKLPLGDEKTSPQFCILWSKGQNSVRNRRKI